MLSWKAIILVALIAIFIVLAYMRDNYRNTISVLGAGRGWRTALATAYPMLSGPLQFKSNRTAYAISWWMENGTNPTATDANTIQVLMDASECTPAQAWSYVRCDVEVSAGDAPNTCPTSPPCGQPQPTPSSSSVLGEIANGVFQYGVPVIGLILMASG